MLAILSVAFTIVGMQTPGIAQTSKETNLKPQSTGIGNKQSAFEALQKKFYDNIEQEEQRVRDRPRIEALKAARVQTGLVGSWITTINIKGTLTKVHPWIKSDGTISYRVPEQKSVATLHGSSLHRFRTIGKTLWGYKDGVFVEGTSEDKAVRYSVNWLSEDEFVLTDGAGRQRRFTKDLGTYSFNQ